MRIVPFSAKGYIFKHSPVLIFLFEIVLFRYGKIYLKAAKSCLEKGADYAKNEIERLERMLAKVILGLFLC